jgi:hypothetical protein
MTWKGKSSSAPNAMLNSSLRNMGPPASIGSARMAMVVLMTVFIPECWNGWKQGKLFTKGPKYGTGFPAVALLRVSDMMFRHGGSNE